MKTRNRLLPSFLAALCWLPSTVLTGREASAFVAERLDDPIHWRTWSEATRNELALEEKPVLFFVSQELNPLSDAMAAESFRNAEMAAQVNDAFQAVVIDRNEHPIPAEIFATYAALLKQARNWPLTLVTTPDLEFIDGAGYLPPADGWGSRGFTSLIESIGAQWDSQPDVMILTARDTMEELDRTIGLASNPSVTFSRDLVGMAVENLAARFDFENGGLIQSSKAVDFTTLQWLDLAAALALPQAEEAIEMRDINLKAWLSGGVRDFLHGGFFSAAVDEGWLIPNYRKSAALQAQAIAWMAGQPASESLVGEIAGALLRDFRNEEGFYAETIAFEPTPSSGFADIGTAASWSWQELEDLLTPEERTALAAAFSLKPEGNVPESSDLSGTYAGRNILYRGPGATMDRLGPAVESALEKLRSESRDRLTLRRESMVNVETNAMVLSALTRVAGGRESECLAEAEGLAERLWRVHFNPATDLLHAASRSGQPAAGEASSKGYALFALGLLDLGERTGNETFVEWARFLVGKLNERFRSELGPVLVAPTDAPSLPVQLYAFREDATGSANAVLLTVLRRFEALEPGIGWGEKASRLLQHLPEEISYAPEDFAHLLTAAGR